MARNTLLLVGALALTACGSGVETTSVLDKRPLSWTEEDKHALARLRSTPDGNLTALFAFCRNIWSYTAGGQPLRSGDYREYQFLLRSAGLVQDDINVLLERGRFGRGFTDVGQTFLGLSCVLGFEPPFVEEEPHEVAHRWRVDLPDGATAFFEGDGTPTGMRVVAWS